MPNIIEVKDGPFSWRRKRSPSSAKQYEYYWELYVLGVSSCDLIGTFYCIQDYGKPPTKGDPFSGWVFGSGGPFRTGTKTMAECVADCRSYLVKEIETKLRRKSTEVAKLKKTLAKVQAGLRKAK